MAVIAKYKFNNTLYDLIPEFNDEFTDYTYTDEVNGNETTRTIESNNLPTMIRFGSLGGSENNKSLSLIEVLDLNTNNITTMNAMFRFCKNLIVINCNWNTSKVTDMNTVVEGCEKLTILDVSNWDTNM